MESASSSSSSKVASLRWAILRRAFLSASTDFPSEERIKCVSRRAERGFNLIFSHILEGHTFCSNNLVNLKELDEKRDAYVCYHLPGGRTPRLVLIQRLQKFLDLKNDFEVCKTNEVDNTGLVCIWPSEDVLTYFCLTHNGMFRNIDHNADCFGETKVKSMVLHWRQHQAVDNSNDFDIIIASDCTFFKEFHSDLAFLVKSLLKQSDTSEVIFFSPKRGNSLNMFLERVREVGLHITVIENYDNHVWNIHQRLLNLGDCSWPNYEMDHCYPLLIKITAGT
ncbi:hypothetical protein AMTRI_Chr09g21430 [Amborella trichopoda]